MGARIGSDGWDHGYHSSTVYTSDYYRELAPIWLDFAVLLQAHEPPRRLEGQPFRYLELGCGMGLGLCQMAAAYPEGEFVGVDFNPAHIAHARSLGDTLGITNLRFIDGDVLNLAADPSALMAEAASGEAFHYVAAHGVYTWVRHEVRDALVRLASAVLHPGGVFYCSVNTYPGWLGRSLFQQLVWLELGRSDPASTRACFERSITTLNQLLGSPATPAPLGSHHPFLQADLAALNLNRLDYLTGEYANAGWQPVHVADLHQHCASHRLTYLTSATLPDGFEQLLAPSLREVVLSERNPLIRQTLLDLATNKGFRRDLFVKGVNRLPPLEALERRRQLRVVPLQPGPPPPSGPDAADGQNPYGFATSFGQVMGDPALYGPIAAALRAGGGTLAELEGAAGASASELPLILALFLDAGWIALHRGAAGEAAAATACQVNQAMLPLIQARRPYAAVVLPQAGISVAFSLVEALVLQGHQQGLTGDMLLAWLALALEELEVELLDGNHQPLASPAAARRHLADLVERVLGEQLPMLVRLGAFPAGSPGAARD